MYGLIDNTGGICWFLLFSSGVAVAIESLRPNPGWIWINSLTAAVCIGLPESLPLATKLNVPFCVGVPSIDPLALFSVSPGGNTPDEIVQEYGGVPPIIGICE